MTAWIILAEDQHGELMALGPVYTDTGVRALRGWPRPAAGGSPPRPRWSARPSSPARRRRWPDGHGHGPRHAHRRGPRDACR
jgi:hypothetical protein